MISAQVKRPFDATTIEQPDRDVENWSSVADDDQEKIAFLCDDYRSKKEVASLCATVGGLRTLAQAVVAEGFVRTRKYNDPFNTSVKAKMTADGWTTDDGWAKCNNNHYRRPGDGLRYHSLLEVALGCYPDLIDADTLRRAKERVERGTKEGPDEIIGAGAGGYTTIGCDHLNQDILRGDAYGTVVGWFPVGERAAGGARYRVRYDDDDSKEDLDEAELATALKASDENPRQASSNVQRFDTLAVGGIRSGSYLDATASTRPHLPGIDHVHDWEDHEMQTFLENMLCHCRIRDHAAVEHVNNFLARFTDVSISPYSGRGGEIRVPCEYEEIGEDGEKHWVRVASRPGAARLKGVSYSSLEKGLKRKDIWTAPNGVRFRNVSDSFWDESGENSALRAEAAGSNRQKKVSAIDRRTQGVQCEYEVSGEDGEKHWVRAASRSEAARQMGVSESSLRSGLKAKDIWTAPNGARFRKVSIIEGESGENSPRRAADEMDVEKDLDVADVDQDETLEEEDHKEEDEGEEEFYDFDESTPEQSECEADFCGSDVEEDTDNELLGETDEQTEPRLGLARGDIVSVASAAFGGAFAASDDAKPGMRRRGTVTGRTLDGYWRVRYDKETEARVTSGEHLTLLWRGVHGKRPRVETPPPPRSRVEVLYEGGKLYAGTVVSVEGKVAEIQFDVDGSIKTECFPTKPDEDIYITYLAAPLAPSLATLGPADGVQLQASSNANALGDDGAESVESSRPPSLGPPSPTTMDLEDEEFGPTDDVVSEPPSVGQLPADDFLSVKHVNNLYQDGDNVAEGLDETFKSEPKPKPQAGRAFDLFAGTGEETVDLGPLDDFTLQSEPLELAPAFAKHLEDTWVEVYWHHYNKWYVGKITRWRTAYGGKHVQLFVEYTDGQKLFHKFCPEPFLGDGDPPFAKDRDPQQWRFADAAEAAKYYALPLDHHTGVTF